MIEVLIGIGCGAAAVASVDLLLWQRWKRGMKAAEARLADMSASLHYHADRGNYFHKRFCEVAAEASEDHRLMAKQVERLERASEKHQQTIRRLEQEVKRANHRASLIAENADHA